MLATRHHVWLLDGPPHSSYFLAQHLKRKIYAVTNQPPPGRRPLCQQLENIPSPTWFLTDACDGNRSGYVVLSRLDPTIDAPVEKFATCAFRVCLLGAMYDRAARGEGLAISGRTFGSLADDPSDRLLIPVGNLKPVCVGGDWGIYEGSFGAASM